MFSQKNIAVGFLGCIFGLLITLLVTHDDASEESLVIRVPAEHSFHATSTTPQAPDGPDSHWFYSEPMTLVEDTVITGFSAHIDGADDSILHHLSVVTMDRPANICTDHFASNSGGHELYSASRNTLEPMKLPEPYGLFMEAGETIVVEFMAHPQAAPHGTHHHDETLSPELVVEMTTDENRTTPVTFLRLRLDDSPCASPLAHQAFVVPVSDDPFTKTPADNVESSSFTFSEPATIVAGGANFWPRKGGEDVSLFINNELHRAYKADAGTTDYAWNIPISYEKIDIPARSTIHIESTYRNPFSDPIKDASGMFGLFYTSPTLD